MKNDNKNEILKEKLKQALTSTARAISDDFKNRDKPDKNEKSKLFDNFDLENLDSKSDFIKARAKACLLYTSPSPRDGLLSRMPSSA